MAIKTALMWCTLLVSVSAGCEGSRLPRAPASETGADSGASAQAPRASPRPAGSTRPENREPAADETQTFDRIRSGLRRLVAAEETFFAENGTYTDDLERLQFAPRGGTKVRFLWVSGNGWAASGTHPGIAGKDCVIYVGRQHNAPTTLKYVRKAKEGVPACDAQVSPRRAAPTPVADKKSAKAVKEAAAPDTAARDTAVAATAVADTVVPDTANALDAVSPIVSMKVDLRNLVRSQGTFFAQQGVYARSTEPFALQYLWHRGVTITILSADVESWSARATHVLRRGKSCVIWYGPVPTRPATAADRRAADRAGVPVCDD